MRTVETIEYGKVAIVRLNNGVTNAINPELLEDLSEAILMVRREYRSMVLAGGTKFFCIGLDLPTLIHLNRTEMSDFLYQFNDLVLRLFTLPLPTCCAIAGHATAGGGILALSTDYRFSAAGRKFIGWNEIKLGIPVPYLADLLLRQIVSDRAATEMLYCGEYITTSEGRDIGLVDEVLPQEDVERRAIEKVSQIADLPQAAFSDIKANRVETVRSRYQTGHKSKNEFFLDCWFTEPVRVLLEEAARKLSRS